MNKKLSLTLTLMVLMAALLAATAARADLVVTLTPPYQFTTSGQTVDFTATITNTGTDDIFLFSLQSNLDDPLSFDDGPFFDFENGPPVTLLAGTDWTGTLFRISVPNIPVYGLFSGSVQILGLNLTTGDEANSNVADFNVRVPEPASMLLLGAGLSGLGLMRRKRWA